MKQILLTCLLTLIIGASPATAKEAAVTKAYRVLKTANVGGDGGFDYVFADDAGRRLYIPRTGTPGHISVFNIDTLAPVGEIPNVNARGATVDPRSKHGFGSSKPVVMWDTRTLAILKTIDVQGNPDGILFDPFNQRVWVFSHALPHATIIDARVGNIVGTMDLGGAPEQAATDGKGRVYVDLQDKDRIAVVDAKALKVITTYSLAGKGGGPAGLAYDAKNRVLFAAGRTPATVVALSAVDGKVLAALPIGAGVDGAVFNAKTGEVFTSQGDGTLTIVKEKGRADFVIEDIVQTIVSAKTLTFDRKTGHVLLIGAKFGPATAPASTNGRPVRGPMLPGSFSILAVGR